MDSSPGSSRSGTPLGSWPAALLALLQRRALQDLLPTRGLHHLPPPPLPRHCHSYPYLDEPNVRDHRCPACFAAFPSAWLLERHAALQHPPGPDEKPFVCEQCGQSYRYRSAYVKHREQNHRARLPADKLFTCDVCGMQFRYLKSFKKHRLNHALERLHGKGGESRALDSSDHVSSTNDGLVGRSGEVDLTMPTYRRDSSITDADDSDMDSKKSIPTVEPAEIDQDDTVDSIATNNTTETATVESDKDNLDAVREKKPTPEGSSKKEISFANISSIADSSNLEGPGSSGLKPDSSEQAAIEMSHESSSTSSASLLGVTSPEASLLGYLRADSIDRQRERRFACPFCGKCVRSKENLKLHVRKHTGERPFVCLFCGRAFGGKSDLTRHLRIHTGERPYHCEACGKCFARADYLSKHLTTHIHNAPR